MHQQQEELTFFWFEIKKSSVHFSNEGLPTDPRFPLSSPVFIAID
jgi:hypothetical protein